MPFYSDTEAFYESMRELFACVQDNYPKATESIGNARVNIRLRATGPAGDIVIHGRERPVVTTFGEDDVKLDLEIELAADAFHKILLGELSLRQAMGNGQVKVKGPIWKALSLGDLFAVSQKCYPGIIRK